MGRAAELIVGLDVGTSKVAVVIGENTGRGVVIRGAACVPTNGAIDRGEVVDLPAAAEAIREAIVEAERQAGGQVHSAIVASGGEHIRGFESHAALSVTGGEVRAQHLDRLLQQVRTVQLPEDYEVLQVFLRDFVLDGHEGIANPLGMRGRRLEARAHVLAAHSASLRNLLRAVEQSEVRAAELTWSAWASAEAALTDAEKQLGVAVLDMGAGTTDFLVYHNGALRLTGALRVGGNSVTRDLATVFGAPLAAAESLKIEWGTALASLVDAEEVVEVPAVGNRPPCSVQRQEFCKVIEARVAETIELVWDELGKAGTNTFLRAGLVFTGGAAKLPGLQELVRQVVGPKILVRSGVADTNFVEGGMELSSEAAFTTALGLVRYAATLRPNGEGLSGSHGFFSRGFHRLRHFWDALFQ